METIELLKRFIRYWQTSDWESFDNLLGENVELELPWLITTIKLKINFILFFKKTKKANSSLVFELEKFVGSDKHSVITGISHGKNGIFCAPNVNLEDGYETGKYAFIFVFEWDNKKLDRLIVNDCFVQNSNTVINDWISQI